MQPNRGKAYLNISTKVVLIFRKQKQTITTQHITIPKSFHKMEINKGVFYTWQNYSCFTNKLIASYQWQSMTKYQYLNVYWFYQ